MRRTSGIGLGLLLGSIVWVGQSARGVETPIDLKRDGAFGFPQAKAQLLCDRQDFRLSLWSDAKNLFVQAVIWDDGDDSLGETRDGRAIGDTSSLCLDVDADQKPTAQVDRDYSLNPWPSRPGLNYSVVLGGNASSHLKADSKGRGAIRYVHVGPDRLVRVDTFVVPLAEIGRKPGDRLRLAYWGNSPKPALTVNSVGFERKGPYYPHSIPRKNYHDVTLANRTDAIAVSQVPDGSKDKIALAKKALKPTPKVGTTPPEVWAKDWLNINAAPKLADFKGKVVVVDFWATWCGPCVQGIPHLNRLHEAHGGKDLVVLAFTDQSKTGIENFMQQTPIKYPVGAGGELASDFGVSGLPHAFVIGKDGKVFWQGSTIDADFDERIKAALDAK